MIICFVEWPVSQPATTAVSAGALSNQDTAASTRHSSSNPAAASGGP